jgi:hypothetical protein
MLMDDRAGVAVALRQGLAVTGTLGLLDLAARRRLIDLADAFTRLGQRASATGRKSWTLYWRRTPGEGKGDALPLRQSLRAANASALAGSISASRSNGEFCNNHDSTRFDFTIG